MEVAQSYQSEVAIQMEQDKKQIGNYARMDGHTEARVFKTVVAKVVGSKLAELGYEIDLQPPEDEDGFVWFTKTLQEGIYIVIEFQPSGLEPERFIDFAVNLTRNYYLYKIPRDQVLSGYTLSERLASWLWLENRSDPERQSDYWWHFLNETELEQACNDALEKLLKYGIPYIEDLKAKSPKLKG